MLEIIIDDNWNLDLDDNFSITMNYLSPLFNEIGSSSYPGKGLLTPNNKKIIGFSHRLNSLENKKDFSYAMYFNKKHIENGTMTISNYTETSFDFYLKPYESQFYSLIKEKKLNELSLPKISMPHDFTQSIRASYPEYNYTIFPVYNKKTANGYSASYQPFYQNFYYTSWYEGNALTLLQYSNLYPFVYLNCVLKYLFTTFGYNLNINAFYNNTELRQLVVYNNIPYVESSDSVCDLSKHLPPIIINNFLTTLKDLFGCVFIINSRKEVDCILLKDIINAVDFKNFDDRISLKYQKDIQEYNTNPQKGYSLCFANDEEYFSSRVSAAEFNKHPIAVSVLPQASNLSVYKEGSVVFLTTDRCWYSKTRVNGPLTWKFLSEDYINEIINPVNFEIKSEIAPVMMHNHAFDCTIAGHTEAKTWLTPHIEQESYFYNQVNQSCFFRLLFWRGIQADSRGKEYAFGSSDIYNYTGAKIGNLSLKWTGTTGLYENFLKDYINWSLYRKMPFVFEKQMTADDLRNIEWAVKHRIKGNDYLLNKISVTYTKNFIKAAKIDAYLV